jgi:hypothetical protein
MFSYCELKLASHKRREACRSCKHLIVTFDDVTFVNDFVFMCVWVFPSMLMRTLLMFQGVKDPLGDGQRSEASTSRYVVISLKSTENVTL